MYVYNTVYKLYVCIICTSIPTTENFCFQILAVENKTFRCKSFHKFLLLLKTHSGLCVYVLVYILTTKHESVCVHDMLEYMY